MSSSGLKEQNLMKALNYNRTTKYQNNTKTAIAYTRCYSQCGYISKNLIKKR
jgi:hypothetical protein